MFKIYYKKHNLYSHGKRQVVWRIKQKPHDIESKKRHEERCNQKKKKKPKKNKYYANPFLRLQTHGPAMPRRKINK